MLRVSKRGKNSIFEEILCLKSKGTRMGAQQSASQDKGQEGGLDMLGMCCRSDIKQEQGGGRRRDQGVLPFALRQTHSHSQHLFHGNEHRISSHHLPPSPPPPLSPFVPPHASST